MYHRLNFNELTGSEKQHFYAGIKENEMTGGPVSFTDLTTDRELPHPDQAEVAWAPLTFYAAGALVKVDGPKMDDPLFYIGLKGKYYPLTGSSNPIHGANDKAPIELNEDNVLQYVRFFCYFVHGDHGPFTVVENEKDLIFTDKLPAQMVSKLSDKLEELELIGRLADDHYDVTGTVFYGDAIFAARFDVYPDRQIQMVEDDPVITDLPVAD